MVCPYCVSKTKVTNSRSQARLNAVWRRRLCKNCSAIFTSQEIADYSTVWLVQKDSGASPFIRDKLFLSILKCLPKNQKAIENAGLLADTVIKSLLKHRLASVAAQTIASEVEATLSKFDSLAALKYVSERSSLRSKRDVTRMLKNMPIN